MAPPSSNPRKGKRLLVAAVGVATVSFVSSQGCEPHTETFTSGNLLPAPPYEAGIEPVTLRDAGHEIPTSGNLLAPQPIDASHAAHDAAAAGEPMHDAALDSSLPTSGNLLPPARDAALGDAASKDAGRLIPPTGNLLPVPPTKAKGR